MLTPRPALLLVDSTTPELDGWELLDELARTAPLAEIPVCVLSAIASHAPPNARRCCKAGGFGCAVGDGGAVDWGWGSTAAGREAGRLEPASTPILGGEIPRFLCHEGAGSCETSVLARTTRDTESPLLDHPCLAVKPAILVAGCPAPAVRVSHAPLCWQVYSCDLACTAASRGKDAQSSHGAARIQVSDVGWEEEGCGAQAGGQALALAARDAAGAEAALSRARDLADEGGRVVAADAALLSARWRGRSGAGAIGSGFG